MTLSAIAEPTGAAGLATGGTPAGRRKRTLRVVQRRAGLGLSSVAIILFIAFWVAPLIATLMLSFTDYGLSRETSWVGFANYERMFGNDEFWNSLGVTVVFTFFAVGPTLALALLLALPLVKPGRVVTAIRAAIFIPAVMPLVAASLLWQVIYQTGGVADQVVGLVGLGPQPWLKDPQLAVVSLLIMVIWKYVGLYVIIFIAGLQAIPGNLYEAAAIDGARPLRTFFLITVPQLRRTFLFVIIVGVTGAVQAFVPAYLLTKGGPVDATQVLPLLLFNNAFLFSRFGYASAIAIVLLALLLVFAFLQFKLVDEPED